MIHFLAKYRDGLYKNINTQLPLPAAFPEGTKDVVQSIHSLMYHTHNY